MLHLNACYGGFCRLSFSPLVPAAVEILTHREKMKTTAVRGYFQQVLQVILRGQQDGGAIALLVHNNPDTLMAPSLHNLSRQWLPQHMHKVCCQISVTYFYIKLYNRYINPAYRHSYFCKQKLKAPPSVPIH